MPHSEFTATLEHAALLAARSASWERMRLNVLAMQATRAKKRGALNRMELKADAAAAAIRARAAVPGTWSARFSMLLTNFNVVESVLLFSAR